MYTTSSTYATTI